MTLFVSFIDFWQGHDPHNNILTNSLRHYVDNDITIVDDPADSDFIFLTIYGSNHLDVIKKYRNKCILWLGENKRPNTYGCPFSISFDYHSYSNTNFRLPLWYSEIDWFNTGLGVISIDDVYTRLVLPDNVSESDLTDHQFCITIFNNPEGERVHLYELLNSYKPVTGYGRPFNNWFPTYEDYKSKLKAMSGYLFNLCPENSYHPGYYTEKCIHSKLARTCPIYKADPHVITDFRPVSFLNLFDFRDAEDLLAYIKHLDQNRSSLVNIINEPLLHSEPSLDDFGRFFKYVVYKLISTR